METSGMELKDETVVVGECVDDSSFSFVFLLWNLVRSRGREVGVFVAGERELEM